MEQNKTESLQVYSWQKENPDRVIKNIDKSFYNYGQTIIPQEITPFFLEPNDSLEKNKKIILIYQNESYSGTISRLQPGQIRLNIETKLYEKLGKNPLFEKGAKIQFDNRDIDEYDVSVLPSESEEKILEDESDLEDLRYNGEKPIFQSVRVTKKDFSVFELLRKYKNKKLILTAEFQRKEVWNSKQKCELIESVLMGLPLPVFYLKQQANDYIVVDGKQRLTALFEYIEGKFPLKGLKVLIQLNNRTFSQLTDNYAIYQTQLEDYQVYSHVIQPGTPDSILFDIFDRVNRGGTKLNKMEIRNALYHGKGLDMLVNVAQTKEFENVTSIKPSKDARMRGAYLMTRSASYNLYFMHKLTWNGQPYKLTANIDDLQGVALTYLNSQPESILTEYQENSIKDLDRIYKILGKTAFRREFDPKKPLNMNMFETLMYFMMIVRHREFRYDGETLRQEIQAAVTNENYLENIGARQDSMQKITARFSAMDALAERICK